MGTYSAANAVHQKTLVANTADTVTLTDGPVYVEVLSDGAELMYGTFDGTTPTVGGDGTFVWPKGVQSARVERTTAVSGSAVVKLKSAGTPTYSVTKAGG